MRTIETQIPEAVFKQAQALARRENVPIEHIVSLAITQAVAVWSGGTSIPFPSDNSGAFPNENPAVVQNKRAGREKFLEAINGMLAAKAEAFNRPPDGCEQG